MFEYEKFDRFSLSEDDLECLYEMFINVQIQRGFPRSTKRAFKTLIMREVQDSDVIKNALDKCHLPSENNPSIIALVYLMKTRIDEIKKEKAK